MAAWPSSLPQAFQVGTMSMGLADTRLRSPVDVGPSKLRRRTTQGVLPLSGEMKVTAVQWGSLKTFFDSTTGGGVDAFTFPDPFSAGTVDVRFAEAPRVSRLAASDLYAVSLSFEVVP